MKTKQLPIIVATSALIAAPTFAFAEAELEEAELFFELNDTDGDLGIHGFADGDAWKELEIEAPNDRELMEIDVRSRLKRQGVTELFFESAEPCFPTAEDCDPDEALDPAKFFKRFPEGIYEIEVETLDNEELESEVYLSHIIPAAPEVTSVGGSIPPGEEGECWGEVEGAVDVLVAWNPVTMSHAEKHATDDKIPLGKIGDVDVIYYEFVAEIDGTEFKSSTIVSPETTEWTIPGEFIALAYGVEVEDDEGNLELVDEIKFEILVRVDNGDDNPGNKSAVESCFETDIND